MSNKLAPCPFCGEEPRIAGEYDRWSVVCANYACSHGRDTAGLQRDAVKLWNQHWANGLISNTLELNQALTNECLRLKRENEKYRRKLLKRRAKHVLRQYPKRTIPEGVNYLRKYVLNTPDKIFYIRLGFQEERNRNPGLGKFLKWQDEFATKVGTQ